MSLELTDIKEDSETLITDLDELRARIKEDPFKKEIPDNSFIIHVLKSLPDEYKLVMESMEKDLRLGVLTVESLKEQVRSKYK